MEILALLVALLAFTWTAGLTVAVLLRHTFPVSLYSVRAIRLTVPIVGYTASNLLWWLITFRFEKRSEVAIASGLVLFAVAIILLIRKGFSKRVILPLLPAKTDWPIALIFAIVTALAGWPYMALGLRNYFLLNETDYFFRVTPSILQNHQVAASLFHLPASDSLAGLRDLFPMQLSTLTLVQTLLGCTATDAGALQAILDLFYTALGVFWLSRHLFGFKRSSASAAAIFSIASQFYYHTYLGGHLGSLMYAGAAPFVFGFSVWALRHDSYRATFCVIVLLVLFMWGAYPLVIFLLAPPLALAKARLLYLENKPRLYGIASAWARRMKVSLRTAGMLLVVMVAFCTLVCLGPLRALFYPNRISLTFNGYQPMYIVFDRTVLEWFFSLRLMQGFGSGFLEPGTVFLGVYDVFSIFPVVVLIVVIGIACVRHWHNRLSSFFAAFVLLFPVTIIAFTLVWPFSYLVYKALYVHYFLIVMAAVSGFQYALSRAAKRALVRRLLVGTILVVTVINVAGDVGLGVRTVEEIRQNDLADMRSLVTKLRSRGMRHVTLILAADLPTALMIYVLHEGGIETDTDVQLGRLLVTSQRTMLAPVADADIVVRSEKGKFALSRVSDSLVRLRGAPATSTEVRDGVPFRWINTPYEYNVLLLASQFEGVARFLNDLPGNPTACNDFADSGYYLAVDRLMEDYSITRSNDPHECSYFVRANPKIRRVVEKLQASRSPVVVPIIDTSGKDKVVPQIYAKSGTERQVWSDDLFEVVYIPREGRLFSTPAGLDTADLIQAIERNGLTVADGIPVVEHEHWFLEDQLKRAGLKVAPSWGKASAVLMCLPNDVLERARSKSPEIIEPMYWRSSNDFEGRQGYSVLLLRRPAAERITVDEAANPWLTLHQPLRTVLWPFKLAPDLDIRVYRSDRELRLLFETGPSLRERSVTIRVRRRFGASEPMIFKIDAPSGIVRIPIATFFRDVPYGPKEQFVDLGIESDLRFAKRIMPYDDRLLFYRVSDCELVRKDKELYSDHMKRVLRANWRLNPRPGERDIVDGSRGSGLALGIGWYRRETEHGAPFRWMADKADIVVDGDSVRHKRVLIQGRVGPSAPSGSVSVRVMLNGRLMSTFNVRNPTANVALDFGSPSLREWLRPGQNVITLMVGGGGKEIPGESRVLDFRVFHIGTGS
jgi:hypothetical protein